MIKVRLKIDVQPFDTVFPRELDRFTDELAADPLTAQFSIDARVEKEGVEPAVPRNIDEADQAIRLVCPNVAQASRQNRIEAGAVRFAPGRHPQGFELGSARKGIFFETDHRRSIQPPGATRHTANNVPAPILPEWRNRFVTNFDQPLVTRAARPTDVPAITALMISYMRETYDDEWHGSAEALERDGFGRDFHIHLATAGGAVVGMVAWHDSYDLHHCMKGAEVIDMFVVREARGRSVGPALVCAVAAAVLKRGGRFLRGQATEDAAVRRLYERVAICNVALQCTISGRAFRTLAGLDSESPRLIARSLPDKAWNREA